jgi:hypothetical protein
MPWVGEAVTGDIRLPHRFEDTDLDAGSGRHYAESTDDPHRDPR